MGCNPECQLVRKVYNKDKNEYYSMLEFIFQKQLLEKEDDEEVKISDPKT